MSRLCADTSRIGLAPLLVFAAVIALITGSNAQAAVPCADLVVDGVATTPAQALSGQPSTVGITVRNGGTCAAGSFAVQWKSDLFAAPQPSVNVSGLAAGASTTVNVPFVFPRTGAFISSATVDAANTIAETNEGNNSVFKVILVAAPVDLVVSGLTINPAIPLKGVPATVSVTVSNQGPSAAGAFRVDWSPTFGGAAQSSQVAGLAGGASTTVTIPYTYSADGTFFSTATVDAGSAVTESNEFNNTKSLSVTVVPVLPDLVVTGAVTSPNPAFAGSAVTATVTVKNQGLAPAGPFTVQWAPWLLGVPVTAQVSGLAVGASATMTLDPSLFQYTGQLNGIVTVDSTNAVAELSELNNTSGTQINVVPPTLNVQRIAQGGFGDSQNSYSWSMAWFKGKLYVGTSRSFHCVEAATLDFYYPGFGYYKGPLDGLPEANCPANYYDLDLRAEIWQYTPETGVWKRVFQSTTVPNPRAPGKDVARDIGFRGMVVYTDASGQQALYVGGVTADEYIPELAEQYPPRILRSVDGETFTPLPTTPGIIHNTFGAQRPIGFRAMTVYDGRLFVTASGGLGGDGVILEVKNPSGPSPTYVQVSPDTMQVYEMEPFNGSLYIGNGALTGGYSVWRVTDSTTVPFAFTPVVTDGAGRGSAITSVVSMHVYKGSLYVGANGWGQGQGSALAAEEIRVNPDNTWDVVVGAARTLPDGTVKSPISGLGDGFGNFFNAHMWRAETHNGAMYIGTNDASGAWQNVPPLGTVLASEIGFDVWGTCDGRYWWEVTKNAFGDGQWNFGARSLVSTPSGLFIGSTNHVQGTSVWLGDASPCGNGGGGGFGVMQRVGGSSGSAGNLVAPALRASLARPTRLLANVQTCGTALSWDPAQRAVRYRILRADYRAADIEIKLPPKLPDGGYMPDPLPAPSGYGSGPSRHQRVWIAGPYRSIGTTTESSFVDGTAKPGARYDYEVVAVGPSGKSSQPSNVAAIPSQTAPATFGQLNAAVRRLTGAPSAGNTATLLGLATAARTSWQHADRAASLRILAQLRTAVTAQSGRLGSSVAVNDVQDLIFRLERRASVDVACKG